MGAAIARAANVLSGVGSNPEFILVLERFCLRSPEVDRQAGRQVGRQAGR